MSGIGPNEVVGTSHVRRRATADDLANLALLGLDPHWDSGPLNLAQLIGRLRLGMKDTPVPVTLSRRTETAVEKAQPAIDEALSTQLHAARVELRRVRGELAEARSTETALRSEIAALKAGGVADKSLRDELEAERRGRHNAVREAESANAEVRRLTLLADRHQEPQACTICAKLRETFIQIMGSPASAVPVLIEPQQPQFEKPQVREYAYQFARNPTIADRIRAVLERSSDPMTCADIAQRIEVSAAKVATNIWHLVNRGEIAKHGVAGHGQGNVKYRYTLAKAGAPA